MQKKMCIFFWKLSLVKVWFESIKERCTVDSSKPGGSRVWKWEVSGIWSRVNNVSPCLSFFIWSINIQRGWWLLNWPNRSLALFPLRGWVYFSYPWPWASLWLVWPTEYGPSDRMGFQRLHHKRQSGIYFAGRLTFEALKVHGRSQATLRFPWCKEAQSILDTCRFSD